MKKYIFCLFFLIFINSNLLAEDLKNYKDLKFIDFKGKQSRLIKNNSKNFEGLSLLKNKDTRYLVTLDENNKVKKINYFIDKNIEVLGDIVDKKNFTGIQINRTKDKNIYIGEGKNNYFTGLYFKYQNDRTVTIYDYNSNIIYVRSLKNRYRFLGKLNENRQLHGNAIVYNLTDDKIKSLQQWEKGKFIKESKLTFSKLMKKQDKEVWKYKDKFENHLQSFLKQKDQYLSDITYSRAALKNLNQIVYQFDNKAKKERQLAEQKKIEEQRKIDEEKRKVARAKQEKEKKERELKLAAEKKQKQKQLLASANQKCKDAKLSSSLERELKNFYFSSFATIKKSSRLTKTCIIYVDTELGLIRCEINQDINNYKKNDLSVSSSVRKVNYCAPPL